jgi:hypothetical protein
MRVRIVEESVLRSHGPTTREEREQAIAEFQNHRTGVAYLWARRQNSTPIFDPFLSGARPFRKPIHNDYAKVFTSDADN